MGERPKQWQKSWQPAEHVAWELIERDHCSQRPWWERGQELLIPRGRDALVHAQKALQDILDPLDELEPEWVGSTVLPRLIDRIRTRRPGGEPGWVGHRGGGQP
jgi:hypothetical protein